jgi:DNA-binding MarR family transcriptional regulator
VSKQFPEELLSAAANAAAAFGAAASAVDQAAATAFAVNRTDLRMIGILNRDGALTAGQLATACGLSPAATTTSIQRLVAAGHATRDTDAADRRRVVVTLTARAKRLLLAIYGPVGQGGVDLLGNYTPKELELLTGFLERGERLQQDQAARIRRLKAGSAGHPRPSDRASSGGIQLREQDS